jgi:hypothetical protein
MVEEQDRVEVWLAPRVMLEGFRLQVIPADETEDVSVTVPVNPLIGVTVIVEVPVVLATAVMVNGLAVIEKSGTATV